MSHKNLTRMNNKSMQQQKSEEIQNEINRIFDHHLRSFVTPWSDMNDQALLEPDIEVRDTSKAIKVMAELPGMNPEDLEINVSKDGYMTISGEKKHEREEEGEGYYFSERSYGTVQRTIPLPTEIDVDKVTADFDNGVLKVNIPKLPVAQNKVKKVTVKKTK